MKRFTIFFALSLMMMANATLFAQIPNGYYNNAEGKTGDALKTALHNIIKGHHVVSYSGLLDAYAYTDCYSDGKIWDIYSDKHWALTQDCGSYNSEGDCWNREHTWPQSWFNEQTTPRSDLFHVMPTDGYVNNRRSNYPYGEVSNPSWTSSNGSKLGKCTVSGYSGTVFEPVDEYKGDIARNFFYMSVRYYSEDSGWSTSPMTNKSSILDWAMTMLLRWSDEDPVSQKEIDRNNAVYGYQNNRNPFIDHPEYARMIWDPNWTGGTSYNITCATGLSHGSISAPATALKGSTVSITTTPDPGYMVSSYSAYKTGSPSTTVSVSSNGTFIMPDYDVTVSATFVINNTYYNITTATVNHGTIQVSNTSAKSGTIITMTATPDNGYNLYSWYVYKTGDMNNSVYAGTNGSFVMPAFDVTVNATFSTEGSSVNGDFVKVTENLSDWSGEYLIVYETGSMAFNGGLTSLDANNNVTGVTISNNTIEATQNNIAAKFTIAKSGDNYTIKSASGYYIGATADNNTVNSSTTTAYTNTISFSNGDIDIVGSGGAHLRYNTANARFRYYKSSTYTQQKAIQLYKRSVTVITPTHTIHFNSNGGTGNMNDQTVDEYVPTALTPNTFTRDGFEFEGWNTEANGTGTYYADNANITLTDDVTLYAQWDPKYTIILNEPENGTISANHSAAVEGTTITLTATPNAGFEFDSWSVTDGAGNNIEVIEDQFEMPADHVTVNAIFNQQSVIYEFQYTKVTTAPADWSGDYLIVYEGGNLAFNGGLSTLDASSNTIPVTISNNTIAYNTTTQAAEFTIASTSNGKYSILSASGLFIGRGTDSNGLDVSSTALDNTLSISNGAANIIGNGGAYLRYNNTSGQNRFRYYKSSSYTSQKSIQLYKRVSVEIITNGHTVTFYPNGASGDSYTQTIAENASETLTANTFTREGYEFNGWNTQADGNGIAYTDQQEVTLTDDLDLYAQWEPLYTITVVQPENGTISVAPATATAGAIITLTATPNNGYNFEAWNVTDANNQPIAVLNNSFNMPAGNVTVSASFVPQSGDTFIQQYYLVTSAEQLVVGRSYLIVNIEAEKALSKTQNNNNRAAATVTFSNDNITNIGDACELTLGGSEGTWTLFDPNYGTNGGYLYAASSTSNYLRTLDTVNSNALWDITVQDNGAATIKAQGSNTRNIIRYNSASTPPIFSSYASGQKDVYLFIRSEVFDHTANETIANLFWFDKHTVRNGATLTVTGTATCNNPNQLILEDGAQLIHHNDDVKATVIKNITAFTDSETSDGWYTIATPMALVNPYEVDGMTDDEYDLYAYDEDASLEWINHKTGNGFNLINGQGYLYAHNPDITLEVKGTLNNGDFSQTAPLSYANSDLDIQGYNLLGNPTAHEINFTKTESVSDGYYYLNNNDVWTYEINNTVPAGRGFLVKANAEAQSVVLNPQTKRGNDNKETLFTSFLQMDVDGEKAYVKLTDGVSMPLISLNGRHSNLYLTQGKESYVMLVRDKAERIQMNYDANSNGTHTLKIQGDVEHLDYLHLIDHLTGADINLLAQPSYTFDSKMNDQSERFDLVFSPIQNNNAEDNFAYVKDSMIVVPNANPAATLQIIDVTGRIVLNRSVKSSISTAELTPGVYMLRLIEGDKTRTQKIKL